MARSLWQKIPVLVRAPLTGLAILVVAVYPTSFLLQLNLDVMPQWPWTVPIGAIYLVLLWRFVGGWGPPASTADRRRRLRRFEAVPRSMRFWTWTSGVGCAVTIFCYAMIKLLTESGGVQQAALIETLSGLPARTVLPLLAMLLLMTGFFEEAAFRGYMQGQLEERYRPAVAIGVTALLFALVHFPAPAQLPLFVFGSLGWGVLTWLTGSIVPGVVLHTLVDGVVFVWAWRQPDRFLELIRRNVLVDGIDRGFVVLVTVAVVSTVFTIFALTRLARARSASA